MDIILALISAVLGGLAGSGITIYYQKQQTDQEHKSLILSFCSELVSAYSRCVKYYGQDLKDEVSYSALFNFTDASAFSRFASVSKSPEVVTAIIELKSSYFQIQRHVIEASNYALQSSREPDEFTRQDLMKKARHAQGTALAFFHSSYDDIRDKTALMINEAHKVAPGVVANTLSSKFTNSRDEKIRLDSEKDKGTK
jgi:hypothetical protein